MLGSIAGFLEWKLEIAAVVKQALIYPMIVLTAGYAMVLFMLSFVVPRLGDVLAKMTDELPLASRALLDLSGVIEANILLIVVGSVAAAVGLALASRAARVRDVATRVLGWLPVARSVVSTLAVAQFSRSMSVLLRAGLTMTHALDISNPPIPLAEITAGSTWNFQSWNRDFTPGGQGYNFSDALQITFCP